jgi:hypothetical protein
MVSLFYSYYITQLGLLWKISKTIGAREPSAALRAVRFGVESAQALTISQIIHSVYFFIYIFYNQNKNVKEYLFAF